MTGLAMHFGALVFALIWVGIIAFLRLRRGKGLIYLIFFTVFYVYLFKVLDYTLFQFQSLLILKHFVPGLMLKGVESAKSLNLVPLVTLTPADLKTSLLNILLFVPFGFGLPFLTKVRMGKAVLAALFLSVAIELLQLVSGAVAGMTFRIADINDVIFNTAGAATGYALFMAFGHMYRRHLRNGEVPANPVLRYIAERPQLQP